MMRKERSVSEADKGHKLREFSFFKVFCADIEMVRI